MESILRLLPGASRGSYVRRKGLNGQADHDNICDVTVERIGAVTIYKRCETYYRENHKSERRRIDGNLLVARATAAKLGAALGEHRPSPLGFDRTSPQQMTDGNLDHVANLPKVAWRTQDRYQAALDRFQEFCTASDITVVDSFDERNGGRLRSLAARADPDPKRYENGGSGRPMRRVV